VRERERERECERETEREREEHRGSVLDTPIEPDGYQGKHVREGRDSRCCGRDEVRVRRHQPDERHYLVRGPLFILDSFSFSFSFLLWVYGLWFRV